jgi:hypothetical protein
MLGARSHRSRSTIISSTYLPLTFACRSARPTIRKPWFWYVVSAGGLSARI